MDGQRQARRSDGAVTPCRRSTTTTTTGLTTIHTGSGVRDTDSAWVICITTRSITAGYGYGYPGYGYGYGAGYGGGYGGGGYSGSGGYSQSYQDTGSLRLKIKPRQGQVYVDGYFVGDVDSFDGTFQKLNIDGGGHRIEIKADGFEPLQFEVLITPGETVTYKGEMKRIQ